MDGDRYFESLSQLLDDGVGLLVGTCDPAGVPRGDRAWGVRASDRGLRVVVGADDPELLDNIEGRVVAVTGADVRELRSVQLKGRATALEEPDEADIAAADEQSLAFLSGIEETDGTPYALTSRILPRRMMTMVIDVREGFDQTPGPTAGEPLREER